MTTSAVDGAVKVVEQRRVSPATALVPPGNLPLTYFDIALLPLPPVQQLFFFDFPCPITREFRDSHFPLLQLSLSLALSVFFPFAGRLVIPSPETYPGDRVIRYNSESDSVLLTLAESGACVLRLSGNRLAKEAEQYLHSLVPPLEREGKNKQETPLVAFQVTVFPGSGIALGGTSLHAAADGFALTHFFKSWASIFKAGGVASAVQTLPVFDRTLLRDLEPLKRTHLESERGEKRDPHGPPSLGEPVEADLRRAATRFTFVLTRAHIRRLRDKISSSGGEDPRSLSTFTVTCAYVWVCLTKSREGSKGKTVYFAYPADCRRRLRPPVPDSYFGNCVTMAAVIELSRDELKGEKGLAAASEAIHEATRGLEEGLVRDAIATRRRWREVAKAAEAKDRPLSVVGSPRFRVWPGA